MLRIYLLYQPLLCRNGKVYMDLGNCHYKLKDFAAAHEYYLKAKSLKSDSIDAIFNDGNALLSMGERELAGKMYREIIEKNPNFEPARQNLKLCEIR